MDLVPLSSDFASSFEFALLHSHHNHRACMRVSVRACVRMCARACMRVCEVAGGNLPASL